MQRNPSTPSNKFYNRALNTAALQGETESVRMMIESGADVNTPHWIDEIGQTSLIMAVSGGKKEIVRMMLDAGANPNDANRSGYLALILAVSREKAEIVRMLIDAGAEVNTPDRYGQLALILATCRDNVEIVRMLLVAGADVNAVDKSGLTALDRAAKRVVAVGNAGFVNILSVPAERQAAMDMVFNLRHCPSSFFSLMPKDIIDYVLKPRVMHISESELTIDSVTQNKSP